MAEDAKTIYKRVAEDFAKRIHTIFETEDTMKQHFHSVFKALEFDRTDHWRGLLGKLLTDVWFEKGPEVRAVPTPHDQEMILAELYRLLDFNLFTQVMLNLQKYMGFAYNIAEAKKQLAALEDFYKGKEKTPFAPKATMIKNATKFDEFRYNNDLSSLKALRIVEKFGMANSYRVTPKGSTPAFADSLNISMIGAGGDKYLTTIPGVRVYFMSWAKTPYILQPQEDGGFKVVGIDYPFYSKSGGEVLNEVLFSRFIAFQIYGAVPPDTNVKVIIPRMSSVQVVTESPAEWLKSLHETLAITFPLTFSLDERPQN